MCSTSFFAHTETSQAKGIQFLQRVFAPRDDLDAPTDLATRDAQYDAVLEWGIPDISALPRLTGIRQPTLIIQGDNDLIIPTPMSYIMAGLIPGAQIRIYPDASHESLFQYPEQAAEDIEQFFANA